MEDIVLCPTVLHIFVVSLILAVMLAGAIKLLGVRVKLVYGLLPLLGGLAVTVLSYKISSYQSTGDGYWMFYGWPHWYEAYWRDFATGEITGGLRVGWGGIYFLINIIFWGVVAAYPLVIYVAIKQKKLTKKRIAVALASFFAFVLIIAAACTFMYNRVQHIGKQHIIASMKQVEKSRIAIVFGAGLWNNKNPSPVLTDRVQTAVDLYKAGKIDKMLMSGDNRFVEHNEPEAMRKLAVELGVPYDAIVLDYAGRRTYDTCYRAHTIFDINAAILVTNNFHLPRAIYTCQSLGVESQGVSSDLRLYINESTWRLREIPASIVAWLQVNITRPEPILGHREPIF